MVGVPIIPRPRPDPRRIAGRAYSLHDVHTASAIGDYRVMAAAGRGVYQLLVDDVSDVAAIVVLTS